MNRLALALLLSTFAVACDDDVSATAPIPSADAALPPETPATVRLHLTDRTGGLTPPPAGELRVLAVHDTGAERVERALGSVEAWPYDTELDLPPGTWTLTVYLDRAGDGDHDACPFPPEPAHTERADDYDNLVGAARVTGRDAPVEVAIERRICGPGDPRTGLEGVLLRPDDSALDGVPIYALVTPLADAVRVASQGMADAPQPRPLRIPLAPYGAPAGRTAFTLGELIPGRYRIDVFADHDGDHHPTPCGEGPGGADRYLTAIDAVEVVAGVLTPLDHPVALDAAPCPDALTGLTGRVVLAPELAEPAPGFDPLLGQLRVALSPADGGAVVVDAPIGGAAVGTADARPFVVSGLPPGEWHVDLYLDRDFDGRFTPCNELLAGFDAVVGARDDVLVEDGLLTDLGDVELLAHCDGPPTGLAGHVEVEVEAGPAASARPVRLALMPLDDGERRALTLFAAHDTLDGTPGTFARRVPPGRYRARIYVDTDRDGELRRCETDAFGDRAVSDPFEVEITPDAVTRLDGAIAVRTLPCPLPEVAVEPRLALDGLSADGLLPMSLAFDLVEAGGWRVHQTIELDLDRPLPTVDFGPLAPGHYTLVAYVDGDDDDALDACDAAEPDPYQARVEFTLDGQNPTADPLLRPLPCHP